MGRTTETWRKPISDSTIGLEFGLVNLCNAKSLMPTLLSEYDLKYIQAQWYNRKIDRVNEALQKISCNKFVEKQYFSVTGLKKPVMKNGILKEDFSNKENTLRLKLSKKRFLTGSDSIKITDHTKWICESYFKDLYSGGDTILPILVPTGIDFLQETFFTYCSIWISVDVGIKIL